MDLTQTESHTPSTEQTALQFTLKPQDISSPVVIKFWIMAQKRIAASFAAGLTLDQSVKALETYYFMELVSNSPLTPKQAKALAIAEGMEKFEGRRLAD